MAEEFDIFAEFDFDTSDVIDSSPGSWIENQLMNDNNHESELDQQSVSDFLADLIVDYPSTEQVPDVPVEKKSDDSGSEIQDAAKAETDDEDDDAVAKKRTRRMRNRDAAVRSRERKKEYVKDLETKSKYLERECMRLGRMLQCFVAENHSLRLSLQNASMTKQESAVLFMESLLLGSLLWYLGVIICQFPHSLTKSQSLSLVTEEPEKLVLSGPGSSTPLQLITWKSRRCKGSRPRMKQVLPVLV